jgi:hypothetical protein
MILKLNHTKSIGNLPPEICPQKSIGNPTKIPKSYQNSTKSIGNLTKIYWKSNPKPQNLIKPTKSIGNPTKICWETSKNPLILIGFPIIIVILSETQSFCLRQPVG